MYSIIKGDQCVPTLWKNGLGETTELAINDGGDLTSFDWRISMAKVSHDGLFSHFNGYYRQLVLIKGHGISLSHLDVKTSLPLADDNLTQFLDLGEFDGGNTTFGQLLDGEITDFNIITNKASVESKVKLVTEPQSFIIETTDLLFVYSCNSEVKCKINTTAQSLSIKAGELFQWTTTSKKVLKLTGEAFIVVQLTLKNIAAEDNKYLS
ncbi:HutD family protein [Thalassotalea piscium]